MSDYLTIAAAALVGMAVVMSLAWGTAQATRNAGWIDVFWTFGAGAALAAAALWSGEAAPTARQWLVGGLVSIWSLRLGLYMASRVARHREEDARYARYREDWGADFAARLYRFALLQAAATAPLALAVAAAAQGGDGALGWRDALGGAIFLLAVLGEGVADEQMRRFKAQAPSGAIMNSGLWAWSRHPNYFFEWAVWLAYPVIGLSLAQPESALTLLGPLIMYLVLRHGTGVPTLERSMLARRGEAFRVYQESVPVFFPWPPGRRDRKRGAA